VTKIGELKKYYAVVVFLQCVRRLLVAANVVPSSPIFVTLMMDAVLSSERMALTRATRRNIQEYGLHQNFFWYLQDAR
jgi:hypothetical protein